MPLHNISGRRILVVTESLGIGGTESHLIRTLPRLTASGSSVDQKQHQEDDEPGLCDSEVLTVKVQQTPSPFSWPTKILKLAQRNLRR
jgi:hypothetical protein